MKLAASLRNAIDERDLSGGYRLLTAHAAELTPELLRRDHYELLYELSRWITTWPPLEKIVQGELDRARLKSDTTIAALVHFRLAEAFTALSQRRLDVAKRSANQILLLDESCVKSYLVASAEFCLGRVARLQGKYADALRHIETSREIIRPLAAGLAAVVDLQAYWLYLQEYPAKSFEDAQGILDNADRVLSATKDSFNQAYVRYLVGRTLRFEGKYDAAATEFEKAAKLYREDARARDAKPHTNILRVLTGEAKALRLKALRLPANEAEQKALRNRAAALLKEAEQEAKNMDAHLEERARIGIEQGYLALDQLHLPSVRTRLEALERECRQIPEAHIVWARIHLLRFRQHYKAMSTSRSEQKLAIAAAEAALARAGKTEHLRIQARAHIAVGIMALHKPEGGVKAASEAAHEASVRLRPHDRDYVYDEWLTLTRNIKVGANNYVFSRSLDDLFEKNLNAIFEETIKPEIITATKHMYRSRRHMRDKTGLPDATIAELAAPHPPHWLKSDRGKEQPRPAKR